MARGADKLTCNYESGLGIVRQVKVSVCLCVSWRAARTRATHCAGAASVGFRKARKTAPRLQGVRYVVNHGTVTTTTTY